MTIDWNLISRSRWLLLFAVIAVAIVFGFWQWMLKSTVDNYKSVQSAYLHEYERAEDRRPIAEIVQLLSQTESDIGRIEDRLTQQTGTRNSTQIVTHILQLLDGISEKYDVQLQGVTPLPSGRVSVIEVMPFDISITGKYKPMVHWLAESEEALKPMAITSFAIRANERESNLTMEIKAASYRIVEEE